MKSECIYRSGEFSYRFHPEFGKWPAAMNQPQVSGVYVYEDHLYVANRSVQYPIAVFDLSGNFVRGFGADLEFARIHGMYINQSGKLWTCDDRNHIIYMMDVYGNVEAVMGERGKHCDNGYDPTVPWPHDLYTITRCGEPFNQPTRLVEAASGDLYVSDGYANTAIHRFSQSGQLLQTWGGPGHTDTTFRLPHSLWRIQPTGFGSVIARITAYLCLLRMADLSDPLKISYGQANRGEIRIMYISLKRMDVYQSTI